MPSTVVLLVYQWGVLWGGKGRLPGLKIFDYTVLLCVKCSRMSAARTSWLRQARPSAAYLYGESPLLRVHPHMSLFCDH